MSPILNIARNIIRNICTRSFFLILVALVLCNTSASAGLQEGIQAVDSQDFITANDRLYLLANNGNSDAQYVLGEIAAQGYKPAIEQLGKLKTTIQQ